MDLILKSEYSKHDYYVKMILPFIKDGTPIKFNDIKNAKLEFVKPEGDPVIRELFDNFSIVVDENDDFGLRFVAERFFFDIIGDWIIKPIATGLDDLDIFCQEYSFKVIDYVRATSFVDIINYPLLEVADINFV